MQVRKPPPLVTSSRIGIVAPASASIDPDQLDEGILSLEERGLSVTRYHPATQPRGYLAGSDEERAAELNWFLRDPETTALICVRGGYGSLRILDAIDYDAARNNPKLLVGYSDITALHLALYTRSGWTALSGPMAAVEWPHHDPSSEQLFWRLAGGEIMDPILGPGEEVLNPIRPGNHEGILLGGNLSMFVRLLGSDYLPDLSGTILFLEEIGEPPYRLDALFAQLRLAGILDTIGGLVLGMFTDRSPAPGKPSLDFEEVISDYFSDAPYPVADGLIYGHLPVKTSMPFGVRARLEVTDSHARLSMLESITT